MIEYIELYIVDNKLSYILEWENKRAACRVDAEVGMLMDNKENTIFSYRLLLKLYAKNPRIGLDHYIPDQHCQAQLKQVPHQLHPSYPAKQAQYSIKIIFVKILTISMLIGQIINIST